MNAFTKKLFCIIKNKLGKHAIVQMSFQRYRTRLLYHKYLSLHSFHHYFKLNLKTSSKTSNDKNVYIEH